MASLGDIFGFEKFNLKDMFGKIKDNPERLLLGAGDPLSSKLWGGITGKDYEPIVNEFGGPSSGAFDRASAAGIDTGLSKGSHDVAKVIAGMFAGNAGMNALGGAGATAAPVANTGVGANVSSALGTAGVQGGPGVVSAAPGAPTAAAPAAAGFNWQQLAQKMGNFARLSAQEQDATAAELARMGPPPPPPQAQAQRTGIGEDLAGQVAGALAPPQQRQLPRMTRGEANTSMGLGLV